MRAVVAAALLTLTTACAHGKAFVGTWEDDAGATYEVQMVKRQAEVVRIVDYDGEEFTLTSCQLQGQQLIWSYLVPSTGWQVGMTAWEPTGDQMQVDWENDHDMSGTETWHRR